MFYRGTLVMDVDTCIKSPVFVCSLDAQQCFDTIWHDGLFISLKVCYPMYIGYSCTDGILVLMQQ